MIGAHMDMEKGKTMRLIDADKLDTRERGNNSQRTMWWNIKRLIDSAPTIEAEPVRHGRWEQLSGADYRCSICGFRFTSSDPIEMFEYCRCGAKMDGERKDNV